MHQRVRLRLLCLLALWASCSVPPTPAELKARAQTISAIERVRTVDAALETSARELVTGFPAALDDDGLRSGDRLLFGVESFAGDEVERFLLELAMVEAADGGSHRIELVRTDENGEPDVRMPLRTERAAVCATLYRADRHALARATSTIDCEPHQIGLFTYARAELSHRQIATLQSIAARRAHRPVFLLDPDWGRAIAGHLMRELVGNDALADLAQRLSIMPGWFEAIGMLGESLRLYFGMTRPRVVEQPIADLAVGRQAIEISVSIWREHPFVIINVVLVPPIGPLALSGGIVTLTGYRAEEPDRRFVVRLLGVEQGEPETRSEPASRDR